MSTVASGRACSAETRAHRTLADAQIDEYCNRGNLPAFDSVLGDIAAELIGGPVKFYHSRINFKLPEGGAENGAGDREGRQTHRGGLVQVQVQTSSSEPTC